MTVANPSDPAPPAVDWRLRFSLGLTALWLALGFLYISNVVGWTDFVRQQAPALGSFLEGAFAPLAFLCLVAGFLYLSWAAEHGDAEMRGEDRALALFKRQGAGDRGAFDRGIFGLLYGNRVGGPELFWGTPIRSQHSQSFIAHFERLLRLAGRCDPEGVIQDALRDSTSGRVARLMTESHPG